MQLQFRNLIVILSLVVVPFAFSQQHRVFIQLAGEDPNGVPPEGISLTVDGGDTIVFDAYVEEPPDGLRQYVVQTAMPCEASGGSAGSILHGLAVVTDKTRPDYLFFGPRYCVAGDNYGVVCLTDADCPNGTASNDCVVPSSATALPDQDCVSSSVQQRYAISLNFQGVVVTAPKYVGTFQYDVSPDAEGTFTINVPNEPATASRSHLSLPIPFATSGATITVRTAQCCDGMTCVGDLSKNSCQQSSAYWNPNRSCADSCACSSSVQCNDHDSCSFESCSGSTCQGYAVYFGDVNGVGGVLPDIDDILCGLAGFANPNNCFNADISPSCTGNGIINIDDLLAIISAFGGSDPCGCNL